MFRLKAGYNSKIQAQALRTTRSGEQLGRDEKVHAVYAKSQPDVQWQDGQPGPGQFIASEQPLQSRIGESQPTQHQDGQSQHTQFINSELRPTTTSMCETRGCVNAASKMIGKLDEMIDPCENFYKFACANYIRETDIPDDKVIVDPFAIVRDLVQEQLKTILSEPVQLNESKPFTLAKKFNAACLNQTRLEEQGIKPLADILESYGGWPVVNGDSWSDATWNWVETIKKFRRMGLLTSIIFLFDLHVDLKNSTQRQLLVSIL